MQKISSFYKAESIVKNTILMASLKVLGSPFYCKTIDGLE